MAAWMASSASTEQWIFTGGSFKCEEISEFLSCAASSTDFPMTISVANELLAMADPHPKVLNLASSIMPSLPTLTWSLMTSPQEALPTSAVPTLQSFFGSEPTFLGLLKWSCTASWYRRVPAKPTAARGAGDLTTVAANGRSVEKVQVNAIASKNN
eukprot:CAMPEP_0115291812 /NCGR_PEP_ID=MMETSP0270-20121206/64802_1 /TAXON_ID=71861 /ORGANISM="Scrippsiella trochoidea, Strain CCMP3099" /LENGTH=155 /DNA_ID=CAMNT_0002709203 /DNA_START=252 /DNA_END=716 /DNA_ORIENTATION=-